jgi:type II secretory pathway component PulF
MPAFNYSARDAQGAAADGVIQAPNRREALRRLQARGLRPLAVTESGAAGRAQRDAQVGAGTGPDPEPTVEQLLPFLESIADLVRSGMSAGEALRMLANRTQKGPLRTLCAGLWTRLGEGQNLSAAMAAYPRVFDGQTINLIAAGEATGNILDVIERLITHATEQREFRRKIVAALAYPSFICVVALFVVTFFVLFLLPRIKTLLDSLGGQLPLATKLLIWFADILKWVGPLGLLAVAVGALVIRQLRQTEAGRLQTDEFLLTVPLAGTFVKRVSVLNFCHTLAVLLENGITTAEALRLAEKTAPNRAMRAQLHTATDRVLEGESLSRALAKTGYFEDLLLDRIAISEQTGNLAPGLRDIARSYRAQLDKWLGAVSQTISAAVLTAAFSFVAFIAYAIVSAVFEVSSSFRF